MTDSFEARGLAAAGTAALQATAEVMGCPVAVQFSAKSMFPENHPQYLGVYCGAISSPGVLDSLTSADVIIAVGTSYGCTCHHVSHCTTSLLYSFTPTIGPFVGVSLSIPLPCAPAGDVLVKAWD